MIPTIQMESEARQMEALLQRTTLGPAWPWESFVMGINFRMYSLEMRAYVKDRDTGQRVTVAMYKRLPIGTRFGLGPEGFQSWVYGCLREWALHELNEAFTVDGTRPFDPHKMQGSRTSMSDQKTPANQRTGADAIATVPLASDPNGVLTR